MDLICPNFLKRGKPAPPRLKIIPSIMQSTNGSLQNLRRGFAQQRERFLRFGKFVLLSVIGREWLVGWNDVFSLQRTIVQTTFTRIDPIFDFWQSVVINLARNFQPMKHRFFLAGVGINSVAVVHDQSHTVNSNTELRVYKPTSATDFTPD